MGCDWTVFNSILPNYNDTGEVWAIVSTYKSREYDTDTNQIVTTLLGSEAFWESFSQMCLQGYTILYGYAITNVQIVAIMASFLFLSKVSINYDIVMTQKSLLLSETLGHVLKTIPCYCTTIVFRVLAFSLTIAFLRGYAAIPITLLFIELAALSYNRYKKQANKDNWELCMSVYLSAISNISVINANNLKELSNIDDEVATDEFVNSNRKFIRLSSIFTFLHHTMVLLVVLVIAWVNPEYFIESEQFEFLVLKPDGHHFYTVFGITIMLGFYSMVLSLNLAQKIVTVDPGDIRL